jgi:hypothetical protein
MVFDHHRKEFLESAIDEDLIDYNFVSLDGTMGEDSPMNRLLPLDDSYFCKNGSPRASTARCYGHLDEGGWGTVDRNGTLLRFKPDFPRYKIKSIKLNGDSLDKEINIDYSLAMAIKEAYPNQELITINLLENKLNSKDKKALTNALKYLTDIPFNEIQLKLIPVKYISRPKCKVPLFLCELSPRIIDEIGINFRDKIDIDKEPNFLNYGYLSQYLDQENIDFWDFIIRQEKIPLIITEGEKKTASIISNGYLAIGFSGIYMGYRTIKDEVTGDFITRELVDELLSFAVKDREFIFAFDNDNKPKTILNVNKAITFTSKLLQKRGCKVSVMSWKERSEKGIDDLIFNFKKYFLNILDDLFDNRKPFDNWENEVSLSLDKYNPVKVNCAKLCDEVTIIKKKKFINKNFGIKDEDQIIAIKSYKASGKTELLANIAKEASYNGVPVLVITHRIQLGRGLCDRLGVDYEDSWHNSPTKILGMGLCIDSLHPNSQARFNPNDWAGGIVFLDEVEQLLWHVLNSNTCKSERVEILNNLRDLLRIVVSTGGRIYLCDADLTPISIDYIKGISEYSKVPFVIENTYQKENKRDLFIFDDNSPVTLWKEVISQLKKGHKLMIHLSGQKAKSKWGTQVLEKSLNKDFPTLKILRIDSETVADPTHPAFGIMERLEDLKFYDIVLASPTIETGISIDFRGKEGDYDNHFDAVFAIAWGLQPVDSIAQTLERVRADIPRYLWANKMGLNSLKVGNGATNIKALLASTHSDFKHNFNRLQSLGIDDIDINNNEDYFLSKELLAWAKRATIINQGFYDYRGLIIAKLEKESYIVTVIESLKGEERSEINNEIKSQKLACYDDYKFTVTNSNDLSPNEAKRLKKQRQRTDKENKEIRKYELKERYGLGVTPLLINCDDEGFYSQLRLEYYLKIGREYLPKRDKTVLDNVSFNCEVFKPDVNRSLLSLKILTLDAGGILDYLATDRPLSNEDLIAWHEMLNQGYVKNDIQKYLGFTLAKRPILALNQFADKLGYKFICTKIKQCKDEAGNKQKIRYYSPIALYPDIDREKILDFWLTNDKEKYQKKSESLTIINDKEETYSESTQKETHFCINNMDPHKSVSLSLEKIKVCLLTPPEDNIFTEAIAYCNELINQKAEADQSFLNNLIDKILEMITPAVPKEKLIMRLCGAPLDRLNNKELLSLICDLKEKAGGVFT